MAVTSFKPTVWAANIISGLQKKAVSFAGVNHDFQGEVMNGGSVKINRITSVTLKDYDGKPITYDDLDTTDETLNIDHCKYFAFGLDDVDAAQVKDSGQLMVKATASAADEVASDTDAANFKCMSDEAGVTLGSDSAIAVTDAASAKQLILKMKNKADKANVPAENRVMFASPEFENILLSDTTINLAAPTADDTLRAGYVGKIYGIELYSTNNMPKSDDNDVIILTHPAFTTEAYQIDSLEAFRSESSFKDLVRGLNLSGRKVTMPEGVIKAVVTYQGE
jgi:hypothetical protein